MKLSVIVPVYDVEKHLARCLDSLLDQDLDKNNYEIIVINDGSKDDSVKIAQNYALMYGHIKIINQENGGVGSARNNGIDNASGDYIYFIDPDDYLISKCLSKLIDTCEQNKLDILTFLSTSFFSVDIEGKSISKRNNFNVSFGENELSPIVTGDDYVANVKYNNAVWWFFINREFLKKSGIKFIEGRWMEDAIFSIELFLEAKRMAHFKLEAHRYMVAPGTAMTSREPKHYLGVIRDNINAALVFDPLIKRLKQDKSNPNCIKRVKARQQSFVFFSMIRMIMSAMGFDEVKSIMNKMSEINAYPLDSFLGKDYDAFSYRILVKLFNRKDIFYILFMFFNPFFRLKDKFLKPA